MATINVQINGINRNAYLRWRSLRIDKDGSIETCRIEFKDSNSTSAAFRVVPGDTLRVDRNGVSLEFGGVVARVEDKREGLTDKHTISVVNAHGWYFEADQVKIPLLIVPPQDAYVTIESLRATYLAGKGWTNNTPTSGGTVLAGMVFINQSVAAIFDELSKKLAEPWRVNGDKVMGFVALGSLLAPVAYTHASATILRGVTWSQERVTDASRLLITTGGQSEFLAHNENHQANGVKTRFPVNVLPPTVVASLDSPTGYATGATSLALSGLPTSATLQSGARLWFPTQYGYTTTATVYTNGAGKTVVPITPALANTVTQEESPTLGPEAFVTLEVGGSSTPLNGSPWAFDPEQYIVYTNSSAPSSTTPYINYKARINLPAQVRVWRGECQNAGGSFNYEQVKDAELSWPTMADVSVVKAQANSELGYKNNNPRTLVLATFLQDVYPWMVADCSFPDRTITDGSKWVIQKVSLIDTGRRSQLPRVEVTLAEGYTVGRNWRDFWRARDSGVYKTPTSMEWTTNRQYTAPSAASGVSVTPGGAWTYGAWAEVIASTSTAIVLTQILPETTDAVQPFGGGQRFYEVQVGVGAAGSEVSIGTFKGMVNDSGFVGGQPFLLPIPVDAIPTSSRVSIRMRHDKAAVVAWNWSIAYLQKPLVGDRTVTTLVPACAPSGAVFVSRVGAAGAWTNSPWAEILASTPSAIAVTSMLIYNAFNGCDAEIDLGVGAAGSEVVIGTFRGTASGGYDFTHEFALFTPISVATGQRIAWRWRDSRADANLYTVQAAINYVPL